jgi:transcriptional regulator with XRE-family HTH domain
MNGRFTTVDGEALRRLRRLRRLRQDRALSLRELGERSGVAFDAINKWSSASGRRSRGRSASWQRRSAFNPES